MNKYSEAISDIYLMLDRVTKKRYEQIIGKSERMETIKIKYADENVKRLEKITKGDWIDLYSNEDITLHFGEHKYISLGVCMELPKGYEAHIEPRSSTVRNFKLLGITGIIDNSYNGDNDEWSFSCVALSDTTIHKGDKICQFRIFENQPEIEFTEVEHLNNLDRGGFGSTGKK